MFLGKFTREPPVLHTNVGPSLFSLTASLRTPPPLQTVNWNRPSLLVGLFTMSAPSIANYIAKRPFLRRWMQPIANWYVDAAGYRKLGLRYTTPLPGNPGAGAGDNMDTIAIMIVDCGAVSIAILVAPACPGPLKRMSSAISN